MVHVFYNDDLQMNWEEIQEDYNVTDIKITEEQERHLNEFIRKIDYSDFNEWEGAGEDYDWSDFNAEVYDKIVEVLNIEDSGGDKMKTVYTFVKGSSLINYDVIQHKENYDGLKTDSKVIGLVSPKNYKEVMKNGFDEKYLMRGEE